MTIWKYEITINETKLQVPYDAELLHVDQQDNRIVLWFLVDGERKCEERIFRVFGTGREIPVNYIHRGTVLIDPFVWHVFEEMV